MQNLNDTLLNAHNDEGNVRLKKKARIQNGESRLFQFSDKKYTI